MKHLIFLFSLFLSACNAQPLKIAIIDTGINLQDERFQDVLCKEGHRDFTNTTLNDVNGHGTIILGLIKQYAGNKGWCAIIYKFYEDKASGSQNAVSANAAFTEAVNKNISLVNFSGGGEVENDGEFRAINDGYYKGITFVVAAGNEGKDLDDPKNHFYPASYNFPHVQVVGNLDDNGLKHESSNYGNLVVYWEKGTNVLSTCLNGKNCKTTGTSISTAIHMGKLIKERLNQ